MENLLPFTNGFYSRYQKSKITKKTRVFILPGFLLPVFFLYLIHMLNWHVAFPLTRVYRPFTDIPPRMKL